MVVNPDQRFSSADSGQNSFQMPGIPEQEAIALRKAVISQAADAILNENMEAFLELAK